MKTYAPVWMAITFVLFAITISLFVFWKSSGPPNFSHEAGTAVQSDSITPRWPEGKMIDGLSRPHKQGD
ncbi:MAG TPA: hypothetical protein V6D17_25235 [Candidatus Obscuribacterales bacterium]